MNRAPLTEKDVQKIIDDCLSQGILPEFLQEHGREAVNMLYYEMTEEEARELAKEDGYEIGLAAGMREGLEKGMQEGFSKGLAKGSAEGQAAGRAEGRAEGQAAGEANARRDIAKKLKASGMAPADIADFTGLRLNDIENL